MQRWCRMTSCFKFLSRFLTSLFHLTSKVSCEFSSGSFWTFHCDKWPLWVNEDNVGSLCSLEYREGLKSCSLFVGALNKSATFLFKRAFIVMKNGIYFIVIALLVAELFHEFDLCKLRDLWHHKVNIKWCKIARKWNISEDGFLIELKLYTVVALITEFHVMSTVTFPWQHNGW